MCLFGRHGELPFELPQHLAAQPAETVAAARNAERPHGLGVDGEAVAHAFAQYGAYEGVRDASAIGLTMNLHRYPWLGPGHHGRR